MGTGLRSCTHGDFVAGDMSPIHVFAVFSDRDHLREIGCTSAISGPTRAKTPDDYEEACDKCEIIVLVPNVMIKATLVGMRFSDQRQRGSRGRSLRADLVELGLKAGDRLEPSPYLRDVFNIETMVPPFTCLFWRPSEETICKHRCPLFSVPGVTLQHLTIDLLQTMHLGAYKAYCMTGIWCLIQNDVWRTGATSNDLRLTE